MKILVCTLVINDWYYDIVRYAIKNLTNYCNKHNYELIIDDGKGLDTVYDSKRDIQWYKILMIKKLMLEKDFDYLFWYDIDSQINNHDIKLEYFIDKYLVNNSDTELVATQDRTTLNTGMMFIKKSEYIISLMDKIWNNENEFDKSFHEQTSFEQLYHNDIEIRKKVFILPYGPLKDELVVFWPQFNPKTTFIIHCCRCSHDRLSFYYMMDLYYRSKLDEENVEEHKERVNWIDNRSIDEVQMLLNGINVPRFYSRRVKNIFNV